MSCKYHFFTYNLKFLLPFFETKIYCVKLALSIRLLLLSSPNRRHYLKIWKNSFLCYSPLVCSQAQAALWWGKSAAMKWTFSIFYGWKKLQITSSNLRRYFFDWIVKKCCFFSFTDKFVRMNVFFSAFKLCLTRSIVPLVRLVIEQRLWY